MANEIQEFGLQSETLTFRIWNTSRQVWSTALLAFGTFVQASAANYLTTMTAATVTGSPTTEILHTGTFPPTIAAGTYLIQVFVNGVAENEFAFVWDGYREVTLSTVHGLLGQHQGLRNTTYSAGNLMTYDLCIYDTAANATTNDGVTGLVAKYGVVNTYDGSFNLTASVTKRTA